MFTCHPGLTGTDPGLISEPMHAFHWALPAEHVPETVYSRGLQSLPRGAFSLSRSGGGGRVSLVLDSKELDNSRRVVRTIHPAADPAGIR